MSFEEPPMVIPPTLGPGDDDPTSKPRGTARPVTKAPGPGDDDGKDRGVAAIVRGPLQPGEHDPNDGVDRNFQILAQPAPSAGETFVPRRITVFQNSKKE